jgi:hypothetical protein
MEPPTVELAFRVVGALAQLQQGQGQRARPALQVLDRWVGRCLLLPGAVLVLQHGGEALHLTQAERWEVAPDGEAVAADVLGEAEPAHALDGAVELRATSAAVADSERPRRVVDVDGAALRVLVESRGQMPEQPHRRPCLFTIPSQWRTLVS